MAAGVQTEPLPFLQAAAGGALIGVSAALLLLTHGRIAGISGLVSGVLARAPSARVQASFLVGLIGAGVAAALLWPAAFGPAGAGLGGVIVAGLLVGFGTKLGNGCTSGHGVCGVARLSTRSIAATLTFVLAGAVTVALRGQGATP